MASAPNARPCDRRPRLRFAFPLPCTRIDAGAMLENINLKKKLSREDYRLALPGLQQRLYDLEKAGWEHGIPSVIVFEGWDAAGKGTAIAGGIPPLKYDHARYAV